MSLKICNILNAFNAIYAEKLSFPVFTQLEAMILQTFKSNFIQKSNKQTNKPIFLLCEGR